MTPDEVRINNYARYCIRQMDNKMLVHPNFPNILKMKISNMAMDEELDLMIEDLIIIVNPEKKSISIKLKPKKKKVMV